MKQQGAKTVFVPLTIGNGLRDYTDKNGRHCSALEVAAEYFRFGADKISIGSDAVLIAEQYRSPKKKHTAGISVPSAGDGKDAR